MLFIWSLECIPKFGTNPEINRSVIMMTTTHLKMGKGKAIPLQAWKGPKGSRRLRLPDFKAIGT